jgi:GT2 family glycosyltransferase
MSQAAADRLKTLPDCLEGEPPIAVRSIDVDGEAGELQLPRSRTGDPYRRMLALVRRNGRPLGWAALPVAPTGRVSFDRLVVELRDSSANACAVPIQTPRVGRERPRDSRPSPTVGVVAAPSLSIVVATCAAPSSAVACVEAILASDGDRFEVIVVENRPSGSPVERALHERFGGDSRLLYVEEDRAGLSSARNAGLRAARGEVVAFTDDDVLVDPAWIASIRDAFATAPDVSCVTGLILPLEFETPAQLLVERFAGFGKGLTPRVYSLDAPPADQPLFPYTAGYFASGANMAFRTDVLRGFGGFDPVLGTGTPARGGEDLDICIRLLLAGARLAYEPRAIVWHRHPDTHAGMRRRVFDYGTALGAMATKHLLVGPNRWGIVSRVPRGLRYYTNPRSRKNALRGSSFPRRLSLLERLGLLCGPFAYLVSRLHAGGASPIARPDQRGGTPGQVVRSRGLC